MTLILRALVVIAILVVSTAATPPAGYVKQPGNDENPPSYRYRYRIDDDKTGDGQGKSENRDGEHATGQYYVNSKRASTDVKYFADEWGYHPVVKYGSSDDHSSASASFAIGEKAVENLEKEKNAEASPGSPSTGDGHEFSKLSARFSIPEKPQRPTEDSTYLNSHALFYPSDSSVSQDDISTTDHQAASFQQHSDLESSLGNDLGSSVPEEDHLVVENAGSFGQRVYVQSDDATVSPTTTAPSISSAQGERYFVHRTLGGKNSKQYLPDTILGLGAYSSSPSPLRDNSVTANPIEYGSQTQGQEKSALVASHESNFGISVTTPSPPLINYVPQAEFEKESDKKDHRFTKPIVVPEEEKERPFQYSTTFECEDDEAHTTNPVDSIKGSADDTTSPHVLNSIQAGVALVHAGETQLLHRSDKAEETASASYIPVKEIIDEAPPPDEPTVHIPIGRKDNQYLSPKFSTSQNQPPNAIPIQRKHQTKIDRDEAVEVVKSIEVFQSLPLHEIHYPHQYSLLGIGNGDPQQTQNIALQQQQQQQSQIEQDKQDQLQDEHAQSKQSQVIETQQQIDSIDDKHFKTDGESNQKYTAQYPKFHKPVYVIPPATYIVGDSSVLKNSVQYEYAPVYRTHFSENSPLIKNEGFIHTASKQNHHSSSNGVSYETAINHEHTQEENKKTQTDKSSHASYAYYPGEKLIDKKVPFVVEKIIEKKVPIPQPYPVTIQVPVPQPIPIHIEKYVEKKVPIPVHIPVPRPYPVAKPIHIPVPVEKIIEKPVHIHVPIEKIVEKKVPVPQPFPVEKIIERKIPYRVEVPKFIEKPVALHAPYGVQYGVSYQQIMKPQNHGLYSVSSNNVAPHYALPPYSSYQHGKFNKHHSDINVHNFNHSQPFHGYYNEKPSSPYSDEKGNLKKFPYNGYVPPSHILQNSLHNRRHSALHRPSQSDRNQYVGPVPLPHHIQRQFGFQSKAFAQYPPVAPIARKPRTHEPTRLYKGNFRQSKIEYGFKPPMIPSVQYDEETASKVET